MSCLCMFCPFLTDKIKMDKIPTKIKWKKNTDSFYIGLFQKKTNKGEGGRGLRIWNFQGHQSNRVWNLQQWPRKNYVEFPGVLVFGLGFSDRCNTVLHTFHQGWRIDLSEISTEVNKWKIPGGFQKSMFSTPPPPLLFFSGIAHGIWNKGTSHNNL